MNRGRCGGGSDLDNLMVLILVTIFIWVAADKIWEIRYAAERNGVIHRLGTLRAAIGIQIVSRALTDLDKLAELDGANPMEWLEPTPENYVGEFPNDDIELDRAYIWYFNNETNTLHYRPGNPEIFSDLYSNPELLSFQVRLRYSDNNEDGQFNPDVDSVSGLSLIELNRRLPKESGEHIGVGSHQIADFS